jgi:hypothetical protein
VREGLIDFMQREYPHCLPKVRFDEPPGGAREAPMATELREAGLNEAGARFRGR